MMSAEKYTRHFGFLQENEDWKPFDAMAATSVVRYLEEEGIEVNFDHEVIPDDSDAIVSAEAFLWMYQFARWQRSPRGVAKRIDALLTSWGKQ